MIYDRLASFSYWLRYFFFSLFLGCANRSDLPTQPLIQTNFWTSALIGCQSIRRPIGYEPITFHHTVIIVLLISARAAILLLTFVRIYFFNSSFSLYKCTPLKTFTYLHVLQTCTSLLCGILHLTFNRLDSLVLLIVVILNFGKGVNLFWKLNRKIFI